MSVEEKRRELFEAQWWSIRDKWVSGGLQLGGLKGLAEHAFNAALDAVEILLPDGEHLDGGYYCDGYSDGIDACKSALKAAGLKVQP